MPCRPPLDLVSRTLRVLSLKFEGMADSAEGVAESAVRFDLRELACLTQLQHLRLALPGDASGRDPVRYTLPQEFSCMVSLRSLALTNTCAELVFEPGWGMSSLQSLTFRNCPVGYLVPGLDACTRLTALGFADVDYTDCAPASLPPLSHLRTYALCGVKLCKAGR